MLHNAPHFLVKTSIMAQFYINTSYSQLLLFAGIRQHNKKEKKKEENTATNFVISRQRNGDYRARDCRVKSR